MSFTICTVYLIQQNPHIRFSCKMNILNLKSQWGLCQNQRENYYCGYKNIMVTLNVNLMMFQVMFILLGKKN